MWFSPCRGRIFNKRKIVNILTDCLESWLNVYSAHSSLSRIALEFDWHTGDYLRKFTSKNSRLCKEAKGFKVFSKLNLGFNFHMILIVNCPRLEPTGCSWWGWTQVERLMYLKQVLISIYVSPFHFYPRVTFIEKAWYSVKISANKLHFTNCKPSFSEFVQRSSFADSLIPPHWNMHRFRLLSMFQDTQKHGQLQKPLLPGWAGLFVYNHYRKLIRQHSFVIIIKRGERRKGGWLFYV